MRKLKVCFTSFAKSYFVGAVFFPGFGSVDLSVNVIDVNGSAICDSNHFFDFKNLRVDFYDGEKIRSSSELDEYGRFSKKYEARLGKHQIILVNKTTSRVLYSAEFVSSQSQKEFSFTLKACDLPKK